MTEDGFDMPPYVPTKEDVIAEKELGEKLTKQQKHEEKMVTFRNMISESERIKANPPKVNPDHEKKMNTFRDIISEAEERSAKEPWKPKGIKPKDK